jgi:hypothetical protein
VVTVPDLSVAAYADIRDGWREYYWEPLKLALAK